MLKPDQSHGEQWDFWQAQKMATMYNLPLEQIMSMHHLFVKYDTDGDGSLDPVEFQLIIRSILREQYPQVKDIPKELFARADTSNDGKVDFTELLQWLTMNSWQEQYLISPEQRKIRAIARSWGMAVTDVEYIKTAFDSYDYNHSANIEYSEFKDLIVTLLKVPPNVEFPENRIQAFWKEVDGDGDGSVDFEEFLGWYRRYFKTSSRQDNAGLNSPIMRFYESVRPAGVQWL